MTSPEPTPENPADRTVFLLDDAAWAEFQALLNRPVRPKPRLAALLAEPAPWDAES